MYQIVVARFCENLDWLAPLMHRAYVYNKGIPNDKATVQLPNIGREAHTYLTHIVSFYDTLAPVTVFIQGAIADHASSIKHMTPLAFIETAVTEAAEFGVSQNYATVEVPSPYFHPTYRIKEYANHRIRPAIQNFGDWFCNTLRTPSLPNPGYVYWNAIFAVRRDRIHSRPRAFYEGLLAQVSDCNSPEEAHYLERTWYYIFASP